MRGKYALLPLFLILMVAYFWRFAWLGALPLTGAEAYLWQQSLHPAPAYVEGPGGNALLLHLGLKALNLSPGEDVIRTTHAVTGIIAVLCTYLAGASLFSSAAGLLAAAIVALGTPFVLASRHLSESAPQLALLMLTIFLIAPLWREKGSIAPWRLLTGGLTALLLFLFGYLGFLFLPALILSIIATRPYRLKQGPLWMFCLIAFAGIAPWFFWNHAHGYLGLHHLVSLWATRIPLRAQANALLDAISIPIALMGAIGLLGWRNPLQRATIVLAVVLTAGALLWPQAEPFATCGAGLAILAFANGLHHWAETQVPLRQEWFPLRFLVPSIIIMLTGMASYDAVNQTRDPSKGILYRAASESIHKESALWFGFPRVRTAQWRHHGPTFEPGPWLVFEDSLAAQMGYYMDVPIYGLKVQYRLWGLPDLQQAIIVTDLHIDREELTYQLRRDFAYVEGPKGRFLLEKDASPYVLEWRVSGPREESGRLLERYANLRKALYRTSEPPQ